MHPLSFEGRRAGVEPALRRKAADSAEHKTGKADEISLLFLAYRAAGRNLAASVDMAAVQADPGFLLFRGKQAALIQKPCEGAEIYIKYPRRLAAEITEDNGKLTMRRRGGPRRRL